jgi:uncharacterized membrane protein HdeD (DUF308 family)
MDAKKWYQSRLVWSGILKIVAGTATASADFMSGTLEPQVFITGLAAALWGVYDVIVRFDTRQSIK